MTKWNWVDQLVRDLPYTVRALIKGPGFAAIVIVTLALGIGANTTIFSVANVVLFKSLPFPDPDRLYMFYERTATSQQHSVSYPNFQDWQSDKNTFSSLAAFRKDNLVFDWRRPRRALAYCHDLRFD